MFAEATGWQGLCGATLRTYGRRYAAPLYVDITRRVVTRAADAAEDEQQDELEEYPKVFIGEVCAALRLSLLIIVWTALATKKL